MVKSMNDPKKPLVKKEINCTVGKACPKLLSTCYYSFRNVEQRLGGPGVTSVNRNIQYVKI